MLRDFLRPLGLSSPGSRTVALVMQQDCRPATCRYLRYRLSAFGTACLRYVLGGRQLATSTRIRIAVSGLEPRTHHQPEKLQKQVGGQAVLGRQSLVSTPWLTERHGYDPTCPSAIFADPCVVVSSPMTCVTGADEDRRLHQSTETCVSVFNVGAVRSSRPPSHAAGLPASPGTFIPGIEDRRPRYAAGLPSCHLPILAVSAVDLRYRMPAIRTWWPTTGDFHPDPDCRERA